MSSNPQLLYNMRHADGRYITIICNAGNLRVMKEAILKGCGAVWFDEGAISNILSFSRIRYNYPFRYDTKGGYCSIIKPYKEVLFIQRPSGIYYNNIYNQYVVRINTLL